MELRDVNLGEVGGAERKRRAKVMGRGKQAALEGRSVGQVGEEGGPGGARGTGLPSWPLSPPHPGFSPLTSLASAFHVGAKAMQWPHQEAKNSTAQALREPSTAPRTVSSCSSVSGSEDE